MTGSQGKASRWPSGHRPVLKIRSRWGSQLLTSSGGRVAATCTRTRRSIGDRVRSDTVGRFPSLACDARLARLPALSSPSVIPCRRMILSRLAWSARPSAWAVRVTCHSCRSRAATMIFRSASAFSSWNPCRSGRRRRAAPCGRELGGHVLRPDDVAIGRDDHPLDDVPQLPHVVPPPLVAHQQVQRVGGDLLPADPEARADPGEELVHQLRDVGEPVAERRHPQRCGPPSRK